MPTRHRRATDRPRLHQIWRDRRARAERDEGDDGSSAAAASWARQSCQPVQNCSAEAARFHPWPFARRPGGLRRLGPSSWACRRCRRPNRRFLQSFPWRASRACCWCFKFFRRLGLAASRTPVGGLRFWNVGPDLGVVNWCSSLLFSEFLVGVLSQPHSRQSPPVVSWNRFWTAPFAAAGQTAGAAVPVGRSLPHGMQTRPLLPPGGDPLPVTPICGTVTLPVEQVVTYDLCALRLAVLCSIS